MSIEIVIDEKKRVGIFLNKKKITPNQYMLDQAGILADMEADTHGFKKGGDAWEQAFKTYLREAYSHSFLPAEKNPSTEKVTRRITERFDFFFGPTGFFTAHAQGDGELLKNLGHQFKSAVISLAQLFMRLEMGLKLKADGGALSDFQFPPFDSEKYQGAEAREAKRKEVEINRYRRLFFMVLTMQSLIPVFSIKKNEYNDFMRNFQLEKFPAKDLLNEKTRTVFAKALALAATKVFKRHDILKELATELPGALAEAKRLYSEADAKNEKITL